MKCVGYFLLLCVLASSPVWGQSILNGPLMVQRCALSCSSSKTYVVRKVTVGTFKSVPMTHLRTANQQVTLETFNSSPARVLNAYSRLVSGQASGVDKMLLAKTYGASFPTAVAAK
jgi:hypothetical protein